ncbi:MAG: hypothetical protein JNM13_03385 [Hyphomicrobiaceae bacterium]|nr:hypothetical protein [Hyphomicrobiaceae bacterium]
METVGNWLAWLAHGAAWVQVVWFVAACAIGITWIIRDEIRFKRTAPKPAEVAAYADQLEAAHGPDALRVVGQAMHDARTSGDFQTRRFLKEVSGELVRRLIAVNRGREGTLIIDDAAPEPLPSGIQTGYTWDTQGRRK